MKMARVTVEDCVKVIESRFELILIAAERARILAKGSEPLLDRDREQCVDTHNDDSRPHAGL